MKFLKLFSALVLTFVIIASYTAPIIKTSERVQEDVFRLHILANSDTEEDQSLKLNVRDYVLENCKVFDNCKTVEEAIAAAKENINEIEALANECLKKQGSSYSAKVSVAKEYFSTRVYDSITLPAGYYQALKIVIGSGKGHNWWCIVFPSVCLSACTEDDMAAYLDEDEVNLIENKNGYAVKFKAIEIYEDIKKKIKENH